MEPTTSALLPPSGLQAIKLAFGDLPWKPIPGSVFIKVDKCWEEANLVRVLTGPHSFRLHKKLASLFVEALMAAQSACPSYQIKSLDGYCPRQMKTLDPAKQAAAPLSSHSWGIAFDINPATNPFSAKLITDLPPAFVAEFTKRGWQWGGGWRSKKDPMHFQFCTGY